MSQSSLTVSNNVSIYCLNEYGKITRETHIHNKATMQMVQGLLMFLRGDFTPSLYNKSSSNINSSYAIQYIPSEIRFGNAGVKMTNLSDSTQADPVLSHVDSSEIAKPTFRDYSLQQEIGIAKVPGGPAPFKFESAPDITVFEDANNSLGLRLRQYLPPGRLVQFKESGVGVAPFTVPYTSYNLNHFLSAPLGTLGWAYKNASIGSISGGVPTGAWETIITEIGLYSGFGVMLARIALDGEVIVEHETDHQTEGLYDSPIKSISYANPDYFGNPIIQSANSSVIVEWKIGIISIGQNDAILTEADLAENEQQGG